jgi:hypothetical protein
LRRILHSVKRWIKGKTPTQGAKSAFVYIFSPARGDQHDMPPGDQLAVLRRLSSFSDSEELPVTIIFVGRPLRKVPEGSRQGAVVVRYAMPDQLDKVTEQAIQEARKGHSAVLVSDRPELIKLSRHEHIRHFNCSTFEKAMDAISGPIKKESREPREPRGDRKPQGEQAPARSTEPMTAPPKPVERPPAKAPQYDPPVAKKESNSAILDLIDPL